MRLFRTMVFTAAAVCVAGATQAQMSSVMQMGGGSYSTNLVSPPTADTQIGRGMLMISQAMSGMAGMPMATPGVSARGVRIRLTLAGVENAGLPVTSTNNHLYISCTLFPGDGSSKPVSVDQQFDINGGFAVLYAPLTLPSFTLPATLQIENLQVADSDGKTFGAPGLRMPALPTRQPTPTHMMGGATMTPSMHPGATMTPGTGMGPHMSQVVR